MEDLKRVFEKIERAQAILTELDQKREDKAIEKDDYDKLSKEYIHAVSSARKAIDDIKDKLSKELAIKTRELDECQEELAVLQSRLKVGEISEEAFQHKSKGLLEKINSLEKKVQDIQKLISARFAEEVPQEAVAQTPAETPAVTPPAEVAAAAESAPKDTEKVEQAEEKPAVIQPAAMEQPEPEKAVVLQEKEPAAVEPSEQERPLEGAGEKPQEKEVAKEAVTAIPSTYVKPGGLPPSGKKSNRLVEFTRNYRIISIIILVSLITLLLWGAYSLLIPRTGSEIGNIAPDFAMQLGDNTSSLSAFRGQNVILVFWDRDFWDDQFFYVNGALRKFYTPDKLNALYDNNSENGLEIIAIASGTNNNEVDKLINDYKINFPVIVDSFGKLRKSYNISYEPTYVFIDRSGTIKSKIQGPLTNTSDFEQIIYNMEQKNPIKSPKPPITEVLIQSVTEKSAAINWITDKPTTTQVDVDGKNIETVITSSPVTLHSLTLRDLSPDTSYRIRIVYNADNINVSEHSYAALANTVVSQRYLIATSNKDAGYPDISNIGSSFITDSSITVSWKTDEPTTGEVDYGPGKNYTGTASQGDKLTIWHAVKIEGLKPQTQYYIKVRAKDGSGRESSQEIEPVTTQSLVESAPRIGKRAPDFTLKSLDDEEISLGQFKGKRVLLNFWLEGCPPCETEMPILQTAFNKYTRDELIVLAVNVRGDIDKVKYFAGKENLIFPVLLDTEGKVDSVYKPPFFPTSFFIDSSGIIREIKTERFQSISEIDDILGKIN
ncbi:MAG: redoxin domain-containing protein [Dehalococcoidia bacterium]|nr:redoxin domain-containing protein [Dehalococcoidia bacterium]MDD5493493.1 redoxin domain-containing protein [Dehalococcoidia bacterium]